MTVLNNHKIDDYEETYGIEFTPEERALLLARDADLDRKQQELRNALLYSIAPIACPACNATVCTHVTSLPGGGHECPSCKALLKRKVMLVGGGQYFTLRGEQTITTEEN